MRLAAELIEQMQLGKRASTDIISIGPSANDYVDHRYGTADAEMCIQQFALDKALGEFFARLDTDNIDYVVIYQSRSRNGEISLTISIKMVRFDPLS